MINKLLITVLAVFAITISTVHAQCNLSVSFSKNSSTCGNCDGWITTTVLNATPPITYNWIGPNGFSSTTQTILNLCPGNYSVTVTDANNCTVVGSQILSEDIFTGANWPIDVVNSTGNEEIHDIVTDPNGNVYAIGTFTDNITFGTIPTFVNNGPTNSKGIFVVKLNYCGVVQNARYYGNVWEPNLHIERIANNGLIVIAGEFYGNIDFTGAGNPMVAVDNNDGFFAALDPITLYSNVNQQVHIYSNSTDIVNGISVNGTSVFVSGGFQGTQFQFSNSIAILTNVKPPYYDVFLCQFNCTTTSTPLAWAQNYPMLYSWRFYDIGMTMQYVSGYIYFTYQFSPTTTSRICYLARVSAFGGSGLLTQQIGSGTQFFNIYDMAAGSNGYLYLCGYSKSSYTALSKKAAIFYYPAPNTSIVLDPNNVRLSSSSTANNEATKLVVNGSNIFISGSYDYNNFMIGYSWYWTQPENLFGIIDHFVYKTDATLTPQSLNGWLAGVASGTTAGTISRGNTLAYDGVHNVYYLGGTFNGTLQFTGPGLYLTSTAPGYDAFIARFQDVGWAYYKSMHFFEDSLSKAENSDVIVYPNPSNGNINIKSFTNENIINIIISDLTGRVVFEKNYENKIFETNTNLSDLPASTYFVNVSTSNNNYNLKLVIVK